MGLSIGCCTATIDQTQFWGKVKSSSGEAKSLKKVKCAPPPTVAGVIDRNENMPPPQ